MRRLSPTFLDCLKSGFLSEVTERVRRDHDLNLEIRSSYINVYYKGNSLLKLTETGVIPRYKTFVERRFLEGIQIPPVLTESTTPAFVSAIPFIKENIIKYGKKSLEIEYEQMVIRGNNYEPHNNTEYYVVDRQYANPDGRFDLSGIYWQRGGRQRNREAQVCLMEIKLGLNRDIRELHNQLARYYQYLEARAADFAEELETVFRQKLELGLYDLPANRVNAMKTLRFSRNVEDFQFIVVLVDYNENSSLLALDELVNLSFAKQIKVFRTGFGMWQQNVKPLLSSIN
jgi:hypothetical protein